MKMRGLLGALLLPLALAGAAGCNEYKYYDIHVSFDPGTLDSSQTGLISSCQVTVSGADSASFRLLKNCPPHNSTAPLDVGAFEYSSFADSGTMNFTVDVYTGMGQKAECKLGTGMTSVKITGETTLTGNLVVANTGNAPCTNVTPPGGGT
jgi:hypothetical protein